MSSTLFLYLFAIFFFFNATPTTEIYTLSLHDALPICPGQPGNETEAESIHCSSAARPHSAQKDRLKSVGLPDYSACKSDRKSTRLNSSHTVISYAVFCLKKKKKQKYKSTRDRKRQCVR